MKKVLLGIAMCLTASGYANAAPILDQANDNEAAFDVNFNGSYSGFSWQQGVTAGLTGTLHSVSVHFRDSQYLSQGISFYVNLGAPWQTDAHNFSTTITNLVAGWNTIDVSGAGIGLTAGDQFVLGLSGLSDSGFDPAFTGTSTDAYLGGSIYLNGNFHGNTYDMGFRTYVETDGTVPEPGSIALLGLGLAGLGAIRRKHKAA